MRWSGAIWRGDGDSGGAWTSGPHKLVFHTTETRTIPGYGGGATAPHFTYFPAGRYFVQHTDTATAARALLNLSGGVQTNRDSAIQCEIVCYSAKAIGDSVNGKWVGHLDDDHLRDLAKLIKWCRTTYGVAVKWPGRQALSYAQAAAPGFRLSQAAWDSYNGILGHQHVPENSHWDPGALRWADMLSFVDEEDDMPLNPDQEATLNELVAIRQQLSTLNSSFAAIVGAVKLIRFWRKVDELHDLEDI